MKRWMRRVLRRHGGIAVPFTSLICPEYVKTIRFDANWRAEVTVRRKLVFLDLPEPGDLFDVIPVDADDPDSGIAESPDSFEIDRVPLRHGVRIHWKPREPLVRYATYVHQYGWHVPDSYGRAALYTELRCEVRTGIATVDVFTPTPIETVVVFKTPRWRRMASERSIIKHALGRLEHPEEQAATQRVSWRVVTPGVGDRYVCVMFMPHGVGRWQKRLKETSVPERLKRLVVPA